MGVEIMTELEEAEERVVRKIKFILEGLKQPNHTIGNEL